MNRGRASCVVVGLLLGLLFYLAYRTDYTLSNRLLRWLCGSTHYAQLKLEMRRGLPVPSWLRGSLPSALWCFLVTNLLGGWRTRLRTREVSLAWLPAVMNAGWEAVQALKWTDGRADWQDVLAGFAGCAVAKLIFWRVFPRHESAAVTLWRIGLVAGGVASMGLADVWK